MADLINRGEKPGNLGAGSKMVPDFYDCPLNNGQ